MKTKNFVIEMIEGAENSKTFIVRGLPSAPNQPAEVLGVFQSAEELAQFFDNFEI